MFEGLFQNNKSNKVGKLTIIYFLLRGLPKRIIQRILRVVDQYFFGRGTHKRKSIYSASKKELAQNPVFNTGFITCR